MSAVTDHLHTVIEDLPDTVRAEIVDGEIIVSATTPFNKNAFKIIRLRDTIGPVEGLIALEVSTVSLPATDDEYVPDLAYYRFDELDPEVWLNPSDALAMAVEVVSGAEKSNAARRDRRDKARGYAASNVPLYLLVDQPRRAVVLHSEPQWNPVVREKRYSTILQVPYGSPLKLPAPFDRTVDTTVFDR